MTKSDGSIDDGRVIVVGSGPCGAIAAYRLVAHGISVTMLDAGRSAPKGVVIRAAGNTMLRVVDRAGLEVDRIDSVSGPDIEWKSSRTLGGLSNYWTGSVPRFAPEDFSEGALLDERYEWPISYDELVPYYEMAEELLVVTAGQPHANVPANIARFRTVPPSDWQQLADRAAVHGHCLAPMPMAKGSPWMAARRGTEFDSYHCIIESLLGNPRFELVPGAFVTGLRWNGRSSVETVDYFDRQTKLATTVRCRAVLLAAGAIDSTTILLRSVSSDFPSGLGNSAGVIGQYLHDHPREWWTAVPARPMSALAHPMYLSRLPFDSDAPLMATSLTIGLAARSDRLRTYARRRSPSFGVQVFGTMIPKPEVGVSLPKDTSAPDCRPKLTLRYDQATIDTLTSARQRLQTMFADAGSSVDVPGPFHPLKAGSSVHFGGSVRMHNSPTFGALDRWNRLHDVPNVLVCDSSCFTTGPEKNPTLTAMAIAARAADRLAADLS
jgi:choline dehydrogenase-like flavoprotein